MFRPIVLLAVVVTCVATSNAIGCNKALCASDVSKCFLQELCQCRVNGTRCPCCEECQLCLGAVWDQCCHCVGLCKVAHPSSPSLPASSRSSAHDLPSPSPSLFRALASLSDSQAAWTVQSVPLSQELHHHRNQHQTHVLLGANRDPVALAPTNASAECSVLFFHDCLSLRGCLRGCESVGAPRSRWFHSGCCQCIGPDCLAYGVPHPACKSCQD
ncbi:twisted gastrulation protein homolog 1-like [Acipenser ruthenus]|uniref:twisted gastrulation protein homolog 1-like n=1 Tax=Acipenser ruthenus TaxID=7906 RepID=UPI00274148F6|nr:twisted gastrulation protein homolog 1-like [Acipenser ruthenus]